MKLFSKRHQDAIYSRKLKISLPRRLRRRLWSILCRHNNHYYYHPIPGDNWTDQTSTLGELPKELCSRYGEDELRAFDDEGKRVPVELQGFVERAYPSQVLDVAELFYSELPDANKSAFQTDVNNMFDDERALWRMAEGYFFKVDSSFIESQILARSYQLLQAEGFEGALDELNEARNDLTAGDVKGAIHNACKCFESVLKAVLGRDAGNASALIRGLADSGFLADLPEDMRRSFGEQVLMALPFLRNRLGGHGQGESVIEVPKLYGELAVNLASTFALFAIKQATGNDDPEQNATNEN